MLHTRSSSTLLVVFLFGGWMHDTSSTDATQKNRMQTLNDGVVSMPLIPHSVVEHRWRRELKQQPVVGAKTKRPGFSKYDPRFLSTIARNLTDDAAQVGGLYQGLGTHYADIWCGHPVPQRQTVIVDTGSGVTAFPCMGCSDCGVPEYHIDKLFDGAQSSSFRKLDCDECLKGSCRKSKNSECAIGMRYQEGSSWSAYEAIDSCYVGGPHASYVPDDHNSDDLDPYHATAFRFDVKFGCQTSVTGLFKTQLADGIMGMDVAPSSFWWQMYDAKKIRSKSFALCFSRSDRADRDGTEAGAMSMGGIDGRLPATPMVYSSTGDVNTGFYVVHVRAMYLRAGGGGLSALNHNHVTKLDLSESTLNSGRVIVDSGTTDTYFNSKLAHHFKEAYKKLTGRDYSHESKKFTAEELAQEPTILFQLSGDVDTNNGLDPTTTPGLAGNLDQDHPLDVIVAIPPEHFYEYDPDEGGYVSRFYVDEGDGGVLGANAMMGHNVHFDVENRRIGWAESNCNYTALVKDYKAPPGAVPIPVPSPTKKGVIDDMGLDSHEKASGTYNLPGQVFCSSFLCQISILACIVVSVVAGTVVYLRRNSRKYDTIAPGELELKKRSGAYVGNFA